MQQVDYSVIADGSDITQKIKDRLISLSVHDAAGENSDTVTIKLDNRDQQMPLPPTGAFLDVSLGVVDNLVFKGTYQVDELTEPLDDDSLTIHGKASNMKNSFKAPRDDSYDNITLGALVEQVAARHNYEPVTSPPLSQVVYQHIDQNSESDMNLLTRLAKEQNAIIKPVANKLILVAKGESKSVSGQDLPVIPINDAHNSSGQVTIQERNDYQSAVAYWFDETKQQKVSVRAGSGEPEFIIRSNYSNEQQATSAANAKLKNLQRGKKSLSLTRPLTADLMPEGKIRISNHKASANGEWLVEEVDHVIGSGEVAYTSASCVIPK